MTVYTYQPDDTTGLDTFMSSGNATTNYGSANYLSIGHDAAPAGLGVARTLIKFDLSGIPPNERVVSATLSLWVSLDNSSNARTISVYRVLRAWVEGQATWNVYSTGNNWGTAGCSNTSTDREAADIGTAAISASPGVGTEIQIALTPAKVQDWITGAVTNNGILLKVDTESGDEIQYDSSGSATAGERPKLVITTISGRVIAIV